MEPKQDEKSTLMAMHCSCLCVMSIEFMIVHEIILQLLLVILFFWFQKLLQNADAHS